jgi:hypothetical protein
MPRPIMEKKEDTRMVRTVVTMVYIEKVYSVYVTGSVRNMHYLTGGGKQGSKPE